MNLTLDTLGVGLGFREPLRADLFLHSPDIDFLEITADHYFDAPPEKQADLDLLQTHFTLIPHGLDLSLGSAEGLHRPSLERMADLIARLRPPWWSEHIAFTHAGGLEIGHLAPIPFSPEAIDVLARNIDLVRARIDVPLVLENITASWLAPGSVWDEPEFLSRVVARTGCGLLCDVTNLYTNAVNQGLNLASVLDRWPWGHVVQLHIAGGHWRGGTLVDSHAQRVPAEVWSVVEFALARAPVKGVIIERDENLPPFEELWAEIAHAREIGRRCGRWA